MSGQPEPIALFAIVLLVLVSVAFSIASPVLFFLSPYLSYKINKGVNFGTFFVWMPVISHIYAIWAFSKYGSDYLFDGGGSHDDDDHHGPHPMPATHHGK